MRWVGVLEAKVEPAPDVTLLLNKLSAGDQDAVSELIPLVYEELRRLAARHLAHERSDHTLQTTALVHEAYVKLSGQRDAKWQNRAQFFGVRDFRFRNCIPKSRVPCHPLFVHTNQHWEGYIGAVVNLDFGLVLVEAMYPGTASSSGCRVPSGYPRFATGNAILYTIEGLK